MFKKTLDWRTKPVDELTEAELLKRGYKTVSDINELIHEVRSLKQEFTGSELNPEAGFFNQFHQFKEKTERDIKDLSKEVSEIKIYQQQQKGGLSVGKWLLGTTVGAYLLLQFEQFQNVFKNLFK